MSKIYTDLNAVLTPYATAIKKNASDITSLNGSLENYLNDNNPPVPYILDQSVWGIGYSISNSGYISPNNYTALCSSLKCEEGEVIEYTGSLADENDVPLVALLALYDENNTFKSRIEWKDSKYTVKSGVKYFRILFGRSISTGVAFSSSDLKYFGLSRTKKSDGSTNAENLIGIIDVNKTKEIIGTINASNKKTVNGEQYTSIEINVKDERKIYVVSGDNTSTVISFLKDSIADVSAGGNPQFATGETGRRIIYANEEQMLDIPDDCSVVNITKNSASGDISPKLIIVPNSGFYDVVKSVVQDSAKGAMLNLLAPGASIQGRDIPKNQGVRNAYKKLRQMMDIKWTPTADTMPKVANGGNYSKDVEYTGLPYSSVKEIDTYIGIDVSFETFMTAVHNPHSVLYTEKVYGSGRTAIGNTYHGTNCGAYYGIVCSALLSYSLGLMNPRFETDEFDYLIKEGVFEEVYDNSYTGVQLMDVLDTPGHTLIVSDIIRDNRGVPTHITVLESVTDLPVENVYTPSEFTTRLGTTGRILRHAWLYKNLDYAKSPFVAVEDEVISTPYVYNDDICTIKGNKAVFREGDYIGINYNAGSYTQMIVKKGSTTVETISLDASSHLVNLTSNNLTYGLYTAYLTDGTNQSDPTLFEVVRANLLSAERTGNFINVTFDHEYGTPMMVKLSNINGDSAGYHMLTTAEQSNGVCEYNWNAVFLKQHPKDTLPSALYAKVIYSGTYGNIRSNLIQV